MTGFEPGSSGVGSDRSANCATTTALPQPIFVLKYLLIPNLFNKASKDLLGKARKTPAFYKPPLALYCHLLGSSMLVAPHLRPAACYKPLPAWGRQVLLRDHQRFPTGEHPEPLFWTPRPSSFEVSSGNVIFMYNCCHACVLNMLSCCVFVQPFIYPKKLFNIVSKASLYHQLEEHLPTWW